MPYKCTSCGLEYDLEEEAKECCGVGAEMIMEDDFLDDDLEDKKFPDDLGLTDEEEDK
jgi:rubredoxin